MAAQLDHMILVVNDRNQSIEFYTRILASGVSPKRHSSGARGRSCPNL
jgi:hypothetical protein